VIQHQPHRAGTDLRRELVACLLAHGSTFSRVGASGKPGAVQGAGLFVCRAGGVYRGLAQHRPLLSVVSLWLPSGLEDRNARPEVVAAKLHEMAEHCGGNALVIGPTERGVLWNHLARVLIPAAERCERICQRDPGPDDEEQE
jgi:hypothetical protein